MKKILLWILPAVVGGSLCTDNLSDFNKEGNEPDKTKTVVVSPRTACEEGEDEDPHPMISGHVRTVLNAPIQGACIAVKTLSNVQVAIIGSDTFGHYFFNSMPNGSYNLVVTADGFVPKSTPFTVSGVPQNINVQLEQ